MKKIILAPIFLCLSFLQLAMAQNTERYTALSARDAYAKAPSFVSLFGNYSMLLNTNYTKSEYANSTAGFAEATGWNGGVQGCYFFSPNFGIGALASYSIYGTTTENLATGYRADLQAQNTTVLAKNGYQLWNTLGGLYFTLPVEAVSFDVHALGGYASMATPELEINRNNASPVITQRRATGGGLAWQAGIGLRIHFSDAFSMGLHGDYFSTIPDIDFTYLNFPAANTTARKLTNYKETFNSLNAGLAFYFNFEEDRY